MQNNIRFLDACKHTEDTYFNYLYIKHVKKCVFVNNKTHYYVQSKNSLVRQKFSELRLDMFLSLDEIVNDSYKNYPQMIDYAHAIRAIMTCEILFFLKFSKYRNPLAVNKLLKYIKEDSKHLKRCSQVPLYRRLLVPLVPTACKIFLCKRLGESIDGYSLPDNFKN
ncbi:MAG: hypothetical protein E7369_06255 [Clostridiales bacterium]|nr:hypothetical protein [Clostridiales bacterium]